VWLNDTVDLSAARATSAGADRAHAVYAVLRDQARVTQEPLLAFLAQQQTHGAVLTFQPFFIINAIEVVSDGATLAVLRSRSEVARITAAPQATLVDDWSDASTTATLAEVEWGVARIGADQVWSELGTTGVGAVVAVLATGVDAAHPALSGQYRGTVTNSHDFNWYDPTGTFPLQPGDDIGLGTHMAGTTVGTDGATNQIGVAPDAQWIGVKGCGFGCDSADLLLASEWLLAPCPIGIAPGDPQCDPGKRPDVILNGWGSGGGNDWFWAASEAWTAAGIVTVFPVGGGGPGTGTIGSPADYCHVIGAGASSLLDSVAPFSGRGPGNFAACLQKPEYVAPGVDIRSADSGGGYTVYSGTSMASAHVAGCAALLRSRDPMLSVAALDALLAETAVDLGTPGFDYAAGAGRIDCFAAAAAIGPDFMLSAEPTRISVCRPAVAATTIVVEPIGGSSQPVTLTSSAGGTFSVNPVLPPGSSVLSASTGGIPPGTYTVSISGSDGNRTHQIAVTAAVFANAPTTPVLLAPNNGALGVSRQPTLVWQPTANAGTYAVGVFTNPGNPVGSFVTTATGLTDPVFAVSDTLDPLTTYYWGVRASNACGQTFSAIWSFTTGN
jgi:hypothetical protein